MDSKQIRAELKMWLQILLGLLLCTIGYKMFIIPNQIAPGGFTGIAQLLNHLTGLPIGMLTLALNVPLFALSARSLGLRFGLRSLFASVGLSVLIDVMPFPSVIPMDASERLLLAAVFGGVIGGAGFGFIIRGNATTGGSDMLAKLVCSRFHSVSIGMIMFAVDGLVIVTSAFVFDVVSAMFALICTFLMSQVIDFLVDGLNSARAYFIISGESEMIAQRVMSEMERGITGLDGRGMYSGQDRQVLLCVISRTESPQLRAIVSECDPTAFIIATNVHEVLGEGFRPIYRR
ncbi:MAG: YitT family protein [Clostridia bacterium]|nr:YitT family protein [Clostridia bacterium]